jgi:ABC-type phosphate transport system substrate-binding protein
MRLQSSTNQLLGTASVLALSVAAMLGAAQPAKAQTPITDGIFAGGSTLASEAFRQIFDCYMGTTIGNDGFSFSTSFSTSPPTPGLLPPGCQDAPVAVQGMYAGVGSGNGVRGFVSGMPDQWYGGTPTPGAAAANISTPNPAAQPPFVDSLNPSFGSYPYPRVDIGFTDSPLANVGTGEGFTTTTLSFNPTSNWTTTTQITLNAGIQTTTYSTGVHSDPNQWPAFEVNVAIAVNVSSTSFQINSQIKDTSGNIVPGGAIQLTEGQLCAIFSGLVTDWNSTANIPYLDGSGTPHTAAFDYANVGPGHASPQPYSSVSLPIVVTYRSDGSGTSFILTNFLHSVCPQLDPPTAGHSTGSFGYTGIFGASNLPNTSFGNLVTNINNVRGTTGPWNTSTTAAKPWLAESGSGGVAATVSNTSAASPSTVGAGRIGYVSSDFTSPFAKTVTGAGLTVDAPLEASLQDEDLRINGTTVPASAVGAGLTFIAPTPQSADAAWSDTAINPPDANSTYNDFNIYGITFTSPTVRGGVTLLGQSVLPWSNVTGAYPLAGTTFMEIYSCYSDATVATNIANFVNFLYSDPNAQSIINNSGFQVLNGFWTPAIDTTKIKHC